MSSTSYTSNLSKLRKIVTSTQSAIQDLETSISQTEALISDFRTFTHPGSDNPTLVNPDKILPLSNLAAIKLVTDIYTSQVKAKQKLVRSIDIACGRHNNCTLNEFLHADNERLRGNCLFTRPHVPLPLEIVATSTVDYLHEHTVGNLIQRNNVPIPPTLISTFTSVNPSEHLPPPLELSSLAVPHTLDSLPPFCDLPDTNQRPYPANSLLKGLTSKLHRSQIAGTRRAETSVFTFTEFPTSQEYSQEEGFLNVPGYDTDKEITLIVGLGFQRP